MRQLAGALTVLGVWLVLAAPPAWAHLTLHGSFGSGQLNRPLAVAVDQSSRDIYVGTNRGGADRYDSSGNLISPPSPFATGGSGFHSGTAVNPTNGDVYVIDAGNQTIDTFDPSTGAQLSSFSVAGSANFGGFLTIVQIATDSSGNVYLPNAPNNEVQEFDPSGTLLNTFAGSGASALSGPTGVVVDALGDVWAADTGNARIEEFDPTGATVLQTIAAPGVGALALDASAHLFASVNDGSGSHVLEFDAATGTQLDDFGLGTIATPPIQGTFNGVAVDDASGLVYVADEGNGVVWVFGPPLPIVTTGEATGVTLSSATVAGHVDPDTADGGGQVTGCQFDYVTAAQYNPAAANPYVAGQAQACSPSTPYQSPTDVNADLTGLEPNTMYHYRVEATNANGTQRGQDRPFFSTDGNFGLQTSGPHPVSAMVSNSANPSDPTVANSADLDTQAGSHPFDLTTSFRLKLDSQGNMTPRLLAKDLFVNVPPGLVGSATAAPQCPMHDLTSYESNTNPPPGCPTATQVGVMRLITDNNNGTGPVQTSVIPVYNMVPPAGAPAELAFVILQVGQPIVFKLRSDGDYGLTAVVPHVTEVISIVGSTLTLWGVPADPAHDAQRFLPANGRDAGFDGAPPGDASGNPLPAGVPEQPFITLPTRCGPSALQASVSTDAWVNAGRLAADGLPDLSDPAWVTASVPIFPDGITGCDKLSFNPSMTLQPDTTSPDSPAGIGFDLKVPQDENPGDLATPALRNATVTLPQGLVVSPSSASGLEGCTDQQAALGSIAPATCPNASQIATVTIHTPLLPDPLSGQVFLRTPDCDPCSNADAQNGKMLRGFIQAQGDGVIVKLPGHFSADPGTGQLTAHFTDNPQLPFSDLAIDFKGGPRGLVATPSTCGSFTSTADFQPWSAPDSGPDATPSSSFEVSGCGDPNSFAPSFSAGATNPQAGHYSPFTLTFSRSDSDQQFSGLRVTLPPGELAKLAGIPLCSDSDAAAGSCPAASRVGEATIASGPGSQPLWIPQPGAPQPAVYLTGPYKGAPYGLAVEAPAIAGPFNLGTVVVRQRLEIDPSTAQVTAVSDPFPTILDGIPLQIRTVNVNLDRPDFTLNPTSCDPMSIDGTLTSVGGLSAPVSSRFQVGGCSGLGFSPKLSATILNGGQGIHRSDHPNLEFTLHANPGDANVRRVQVTLPPSFQIDQANLGNICSETELAQTRCAGRNTVGTARASTPLLDYPLSGPVYAVSGSGGLPRLAVILNGPPATPLQLILRGETTTLGNRIQNTFATVPDAPVTDFSLTLNDGPGGYLVDNTNVCQGAKGHSPRALKRARKLRTTNLTAGALIDGQNGKTADQQIPIMARCAPLAKKHHKKHHG